MIRARAQTPRPGSGLALIDGTPDPRRLALLGFGLLAVDTILMLARVEPFATWFYLFAWYPTLVLLDCAIAAKTGQYYLIARPRAALSLFLWSAVMWFVFELVNFRLENWYYVFLPPDRTLRWSGTVLSFMTVLPAIFLAERLLRAYRVATGIRWPTFRIGPRTLSAVWLTGVGFFALTLAWPRIFYPMIWGALTLLLEPWNYRRDPERSLLGDLSAGRPGRVLRLLLAGLAIGFIWEIFNIYAVGKWIYTVPGFENIKLFEMPVPGFLGFPIFAMDCFVIYQSLVLAGLAMPVEGARARAGKAIRIGRTLVAGGAASLFCIAALLGMERWNIDSYTPQLKGLRSTVPTAAEQLAETTYSDVFLLAKAQPAAVATVAGVSPAEAGAWISAARVATLRGIGTHNGMLLWHAGIRSVADLATADPESLSRKLRRTTQRPRTATSPKVRVWVRAARRAVTDLPHTAGRAAGAE